jgi:chromate transporter
MKDDSVLWSLAGNFALISLFAVGGANAAVPEMHRLAVDLHHWMTDKQFADLFAIAQLSPGPNVIIVTLIGYQAAGVAGAIVATLAMCGPTCVFAFYMGRVWDKYHQARWRNVVQNGLVPVSIGLIAASALILAQAADHNAIAWAVTIGTAVVAYFTRLNPLWLFAAAGLIGLAGFI